MKIKKNSDYMVWEYDGLFDLEGNEGLLNLENNNTHVFLYEKEIHILKGNLENAFASKTMPMEIKILFVSLINSVIHLDSDTIKKRLESVHFTCLSYIYKFINEKMSDKYYREKYISKKIYEFESEYGFMFDDADTDEETLESIKKIIRVTLNLIILITSVNDNGEYIPKTKKESNTNDSIESLVIRLMKLSLMSGVLIDVISEEMKDKAKQMKYEENKKKWS